jgi:hypothetical protein
MLSVLLTRLVDHVLTTMVTHVLEALLGHLWARAWA